MRRYLLIIYLLVCMGMFVGSSVVSASAGILFPVVREDGLWSRDDMMIVFDVKPNSGVVFSLMNKATNKPIVIDITKITIEREGMVYQTEDMYPNNHKNVLLVAHPSEMCTGIMFPISDEKLKTKIGEEVIFNLPYLLDKEEKFLSVRLMRID